MTDKTEQMDLLQTSEKEGCEGTPMAVFPAPRMEKRGPGRPKGATNRKTQAIEKLYRAKGLRDPLLAQGEIASAHPLDLHKQIVVMQAHAQGIKADKAMDAYRAGTLFGVPSIAEVMALQTKVQDQLTPYLYGKKPQQSEEENDRLPMLFIDLGDDSQSETNQASEGLLSIGHGIEDQSQQNQSLSKSDNQASHDKVSHEAAKPLKDKGE
ncbi:hypothetical protein SAMN04488056_112154 [Cohaesibacter marisflavi]|uniref:Uncharacterized protein n=1 Tax=Cohaesibacter marisflavi TaxID=655353 RepID=A0A1I5JXP7_9HYPH|nr:hypothetical protein [Cohaesibacter marisflavi]SFO77565.1 hypothetical protein SAMN04488056_112154 [Cohaesibacter marisflavi]